MCDEYNLTELKKKKQKQNELKGNISLLLIKIAFFGAGEKAQWLRGLVDLMENLVLIPSTHLP